MIFKRIFQEIKVIDSLQMNKKMEKMERKLAKMMMETFKKNNYKICK